MKLLCMGDLHYRASQPRGRKDDYVTALLGKVRQVVRIADEHDCQYIIQPGDMFDRPEVPMWLLREAIRIHGRGRVLCVLGQHDQRYHHHAVANTPVGVMEAARAVRVLGPRPYRQPGVEFYGASWSDDIPPPGPSKACKVLVAHRMVVKAGPLWPGQTDYTRAGRMLRKHKYDLIVTGDNHQFFVEQDTSARPRYLVNCGSLMRTNTDQADHRPSVVVYDTERRSIQVVELDVAPASEVLDTEHADEGRARSEELEAFIEEVGHTRGAPDLDFLATLRKLAQGKGVAQGVREKVDEIVGMSE